MVLNSYHKEATYDLKEEAGPQHAREYVYSVTVMGIEYYGRGKNKKTAKQQAAANALNAMHGIKVSLGKGAYSGGGDTYTHNSQYTHAHVHTHTCHTSCTCLH